MCGRIVQKSPQAEYVETIFANLGLIFDGALAPRYNIPPGTRVLALHRLGGSPAVEHLWWGYGPPWWRRQPVINARIDTLLRGSPMWRPLLVRRVIVPANGWFEWTPEDAALELLTVARPESAFQWHRVSKRMNSARYQLPDALAPI